MYDEHRNTTVPRGLKRAVLECILVNLGASLPLGARGALGFALESRRLVVTRFVREFRVAWLIDTPAKNVL